MADLQTKLKSADKGYLNNKEFDTADALRRAKYNQKIADLQSDRLSLSLPFAVSGVNKNPLESDYVNPEADASDENLDYNWSNRYNNNQAIEETDDAEESNVDYYGFEDDDMEQNQDYEDDYEDEDNGEDEEDVEDDDGYYDQMEDGRPKKPGKVRQSVDKLEDNLSTGPSELLTASWLNLIDTFGLTLIWINIHVFLHFIVSKKIFVALGQEWVTMVPGGNKALSEFKKLDAAKEAVAGVGMVEYMLLLFLDLLLLFIVIIIAAVIIAIIAVIEDLGKLFTLLWEIVWDLV
ncbi:MAG: hypothetical protein PHR00_04560 [Patescibacteria group bacterium]|nr:hypothetical protein [Patescibacteria group bacterium]